MPDGKIKSSTGKANVTKQGHTSDGQHGSNLNAKVKGRSGVRDLGAK